MLEPGPLQLHSVTAVLTGLPLVGLASSLDDYNGQEISQHQVRPRMALPQGTDCQAPTLGLGGDRSL